LKTRLHNAASRVQNQGRLIHEAEVAKVAQAIVEYLFRYPDASDTVDGIRQFWFPEWQIVPSEKVVLDALQELVENGLLVEISSRAGKNIYGRMKTRAED
jgi:hypothetical protein